MKERVSNKVNTFYKDIMFNIGFPMLPVERAYSCYVGLCYLHAHAT